MKKPPNVRDYVSLVKKAKTLPTIFTCLQFQALAGFKTKWGAYTCLNAMHDRGLVYRQKLNGKVVHWSMSPMPEEAPKKPLGRVFTTREYGDYYNLSDPHRMLYRAATEDKVFRVGRVNGNGLILWTFDKAAEGDEYALKRKLAAGIVPKDRFANIFSN